MLPNAHDGWIGGGSFLSGVGVFYGDAKWCVFTFPIEVELIDLVWFKVRTYGTELNGLKCDTKYKNTTRYCKVIS